MNKRVGVIINKAFAEKTVDLLLEEIEERKNITKEKHLKKYNELDASFIKFDMVPVNPSNGIGVVDQVKWYRLKNKKDHAFVKSEHIKMFKEGGMVDE